MRIGLVTGEYPPMQGGVGAFTQVLGQHIQRLGHDVHVFTHEKAAAHDDKITVTNAVDRWSFGTVRGVDQWARDNRLDVINLQFQTAAYGMSAWVHFLPNLTSVPVVTTFHDLRFPYLFPKAGKIRKWVTKHLARSSAGTIFTNAEDYQRLRDLNTTRMIPIGSNILTALPDDYNRDAWRKKARADDDDFLLAHFGFINHTKGIETLLYAMRECLVADDVPVQLVMIGGRTGASDPTNITYNSKVDQLIKELKLSKHVTWTGFVTEEEVTCYFHAADLVTLPYVDGASYRRGSLMAAIQHECAIISTYPQVPAEGLTEENLCLLPPFDSESLAGVIGHFEENRHILDKLRAGAKRIKHLFDWDTIARDTVDFYEQVVS